MSLEGDVGWVVISVQLEDNELGRPNSKNDCPSVANSSACIANSAVWGIGSAQAIVAAISEHRIFVNQLACSCSRVDLDHMGVVTFVRTKQDIMEWKLVESQWFDNHHDSTEFNYLGRLGFGVVV